jgi:hypothetical protein
VGRGTGTATGELVAVVEEGGVGEGADFVFFEWAEGDWLS